MIFVYPNQILSDNIYILKQSVFKNLRLPINRKNREQITNIIAQLYKNKLQLAKKTRNKYEKTDPGIFWFLNTSGYRQQLILVCFICKKAFKLFPDLVNCCDNSIYNYTDANKISGFELHDMTAKLAMIYKKILNYSELQHFAKCDHLHATNPQNPKTITKQIFIWEEVLDDFAR